MNLNDLSSVLIPFQIKLNILDEGEKYFYLDLSTGEYKEKDGIKDMFDLYGGYQLDRIYEGEGKSVTLDIRWRKDLYGKKIYK